MTVHNHPPYRPMCNERVVDGKLKGACMTDADQHMTLTEFLLARIAEDERAAKGAYSAARWVAINNDHSGDVSQPVMAEVWTEPYESAMGGGERAHRVCIAAPESGPYALAFHARDAEHIARHDPARVLAECEAKRNLIGLATDRLFDRTYSSEILGILALPYADHPDYQEEWKP